MDKKIRYIVIGMLIVLLLQGCGSKEETRDELMQYFNEDLHTILMDEYKRQSTKQFDAVDENLDEKFRVHLEIHLIPAAESALEYIESLDYKSKEVRKLKELYTEINMLALEALQDMEAGFKEGSTLDEMEQLLEENNRESQRKGNQYYQELERLLEKYDFELYTEYEGRIEKEKLRKR